MNIFIICFTLCICVLISEEFAWILYHTCIRWRANMWLRVIHVITRRGVAAIYRGTDVLCNPVLIAFFLSTGYLIVSDFPRAIRAVLSMCSSTRPPSLDARTIYNYSTRHVNSLRSNFHSNFKQIIILIRIVEWIRCISDCHRNEYFLNFLEQNLI